MLFNNHACVKNPNVMDDPLRGVVALLSRCPPPAGAVMDSPKLDCARHLAEGLVNITFRHEKNCVKLREGNGIHHLLRHVQVRCMPESLT